MCCEQVLDVSQTDPFRTLIGTQLTLNRPVQMVQERSVDAAEVLPSLWEQERTFGDGGAQRLAMAPSGNSIHIERAPLRQGGVSGFTHVLVIGTLNVGGQIVQFCFPWSKARPHRGSSLWDR